MINIFRSACALLVAVTWSVMAPAYAQTPVPASGSPARTILVLGDSLSAEYGLRRGTGWVTLLEQRLSQKHPDYRVVNASISGETTGGGVARLSGLLSQHQPAVVVLELGANDGLRGLSLDMTESNLRSMATAARDAGAKVVVVGMQIPPNYGRPYAQRFSDTFGTVARDTQAELVPFLLEGIATDVSMFQADRIHPSEAAQEILLENVWPVLEPVL